MNLYKQTLLIAKLKPKIQKIAFDLMMENPEKTQLEELISFMDYMITNAPKVHQLAPIPEATEEPVLNYKS